MPVCTSDGICYDLLNIIPYLKKHGTDPVTGQKLGSGDLIKLNFSRNADGKMRCPMSPYTSSKLSIRRLSRSVDFQSFHSAHSESVYSFCSAYMHVS